MCSETAAATVRTGGDLLTMQSSEVLWFINTVCLHSQITICWNDNLKQYMSTLHSVTDWSTQMRHSVAILRPRPPPPRPPNSSTTRQSKVIYRKTTPPKWYLNHTLKKFLGPKPHLTTKQAYE